MSIMHVYQSTSDVDSCLSSMMLVLSVHWSIYCLFIGSLGSDDGNTWKDASEGFDNILILHWRTYLQLPLNLILLSFRFLVQEDQRITLIGMEI
jgi:hypothetical protein